MIIASEAGRIDVVREFLHRSPPVNIEALTETGCTALYVAVRSDQIEVARVLLEAAAMLHDVGHMVSHRGHHKHGEYLALNGDIQGLDGHDRCIVAAAVRYHNRKSTPNNDHSAYSALNNSEKRIARRLAAILRIAEGLDHSHRQRIQDLRASFQRGAVTIQLRTRGDATEDIRDAERSSNLFEREFHTHLYLRPSNFSRHQ